VLLLMLVQTGQLSKPDDQAKVWIVFHASNWLGVAPLEPSDAMVTPSRSSRRSIALEEADPLHFTRSIDSRALYVSAAM
jgi:hypothetical protein